jgi:hypothetical protein
MVTRPHNVNQNKRQVRIREGNEWQLVGGPCTRVVERLERDAPNELFIGNVHDLSK